MTKVSIPDSVEEVGEGTFDGCKALRKFEVSAGNHRYSSYYGILVNKSQEDLVAFPDGKMAGFPHAASNPLWNVRDRVRKVLSEREDVFSKWAERHRVLEPTGNEDDLFFFDELLQAVPHVTLPDGYRLAAKVTPHGCDSKAEFLGVKEGRRLPIWHVLCPDGTPESYWEAVVLWFETNQFYRCRHANYGSEELVPDLQSFLRECYTFGGETGKTIFKSLSQKDRWQLVQMAFRPELNPVEDGCKVYYTAFAPFGGFIRYCATIQNWGNASIIQARRIEQIKYRCPVMF